MNRIVEKRVISLKNSSRQKTFFEQEEAAEFTLFNAYDGRLGEGYEYFNQEGFSNLHLGGKALPGEIGCAVSHYKLLEEFALSPGNPQDFLMVAEDDVKFLPEFSATLDNILGLKLDADIVILSSARGEGGIRNIASNSEWEFQQSLFSKSVGKSWCDHTYRLGTYSGTVWGSGLYIIRREAAKSYIDFVTRCGGIHWYADAWGYFKHPAQLEIQVVRPPMTNFDGVSEIRNFQKDEKSHVDPKSLTERIAVRTRIRQFTGRISATLSDLAHKTRYTPK